MLRPVRDMSSSWPFSNLSAALRSVFSPSPNGASIIADDDDDDSHNSE